VGEGGGDRDPGRSTNASQPRHHLTPAAIPGLTEQDLMDHLLVDWLEQLYTTRTCH
jgi:hypothetical protein